MTEDIKMKNLEVTIADLRREAIQAASLVSSANIELKRSKEELDKANLELSKIREQKTLEISELLREKEQYNTKCFNLKELILTHNEELNKLSEIKKDDWNAEKLEKILLSETEKTGSELNMVGDRGHLLWPLRAALTGKEFSAGPFEIAEILGKEKTLKRLEIAKNLIK